MLMVMAAMWALVNTSSAENFNYNGVLQNIYQHKDAYMDIHAGETYEVSYIVETVLNSASETKSEVDDSFKVACVGEARNKFQIIHVEDSVATAKMALSFPYLNEKKECVYKKVLLIKELDLNDLFYGLYRHYIEIGQYLAKKDAPSVQQNNFFLAGDRIYFDAKKSSGPVMIVDMKVHLFYYFAGSLVPGFSILPNYSIKKRQPVFFKGDTVPVQDPENNSVFCGKSKSIDQCVLESL